MLSKRTFLMLIVASAFLLRLAVMIALDATFIEDDWRFGYETGRIASSLAEGNGFSSPFRHPSGPTAWLMPAYPALLALVFKSLGVYSHASAVAILLFNCAMAALTCLALFRLGEDVLGTAPGLVAASLFAVYPPSVWHAVNTIWNTSLLGLVVVLLVHGLYRLAKARDAATILTFGVALGAALWVSPVILTLLPLAWFQLLRGSERTWAWKTGALALLTAATLAVVSPWIIRNQRTFGRPFLRSNLGLELRLGNSPRSWENYIQRSDRSLFVDHPSISEREFERYVELGEVRYVDQAFEEAVRFAKAYPMRFIRLCLWRLEVFWLSDLRVPNEWAGNLSISGQLSWMRTASHLLPLPFLIVGTVSALRRRLDVLPLVGAMVVFPVPYYLTHVSERYRFPIEPMIVILASYGLFRLFRLALSRTEAQRAGSVGSSRASLEANEKD